MFDGIEDFRIPWEQPDPPKPAKVVLTKTQERTMMRMIAFNVVLAFVAPIGGATLFAAIRSLLF